MAFQNSHFSLAYDRPSITMVSQPEIPFDQKSMPGHRPYFETLCRIVAVALELLRLRMLPGNPYMRYSEIRVLTDRIQRILSEASPHLRFRDRCLSLAEHIERIELRLHSSYVTSVICRAALDRRAPLDSKRRAVIRDECLASLFATVEAFVELHSLNPFASRSWISLQRTISSVFLLVATEDGQSYPQTWDLVEKLDHVLSAHVPADPSCRSDSAKHIAASLQSLREVSAIFHARRQQTTNKNHDDDSYGTSDKHRVSKNTLQEKTLSMAVSPPSATGPSPPTTLLPSPASTELSTAVSNPPAVGIDTGMLGAHLTTADNLLNRDSSMLNVLDQVSDVMLFPSMAGGPSFNLGETMPSY